MRIELSDHAKCRLFQRNINILDIKKIINGLSKIENARGGCLKKKGKIDNEKVLEVVYRKVTKNKFVIITAYYEC